MNHCFALCIVLAYGIYEECCEGEINEEWKIEKKERLTYSQFRERLSDQMLEYEPKKQIYPGDERMRVVTSMTKVNRARSRKRDGPVISVQTYKKAKRYGNSRLCGNLDKLCNHVRSIKTVNKGCRICAWCGETTYSFCNKCKDENGKPIPLHYNPRGSSGNNKKLCFYQYHNDTHFGLGKNDATRILGKKKSEWTPPDTTDVSTNTSYIQELAEEANL